MITAGVDVGSMTGKALILKDNEILSFSIIPTGADSAQTAQKAMDLALEQAKLTMKDPEYIVSTGYGRTLVPFGNRTITEISCHAKGAHWFFPNARTVLDMGGQDCKAIQCDAGGKVTNFLMNDKCAAGAGRYMEVMSKLVGVPLEKLGELSLNTMNGPAKISSTCVLFAKTDVLTLVQEGTSTNDILAGAADALSERVVGLLRRVGVEGELVISGGIAKNIGVVRRLEERLGTKASICFEPQIVGSLGAALFAREFLQKAKARSGNL